MPAPSALTAGPFSSSWLVGGRGFSGGCAGTGLSARDGGKQNANFLGASQLPVRMLLEEAVVRCSLLEGSERGPSGSLDTPGGQFLLLQGKPESLGHWGQGVGAIRQRKAECFFPE